MTRNEDIDNSHRIEDLSMEMKELVQLIRDGGISRKELYGRLYRARTELGKVVAQYGEGVPK